MHLACPNRNSKASFLEPEVWIFLYFPGLCLVLSLVGSVTSGDPSCSTSSPGGHLVDGLPPAANRDPGRSEHGAKHSPPGLGLGCPKSESGGVPGLL